MLTPTSMGFLLGSVPCQSILISPKAVSAARKRTLCAVLVGASLKTRKISRVTLTGEHLRVTGVHG